MDVTNTTAMRFDAGIDLFLEGQSLVYENVMFSKDKNNKLFITSFSNGAASTEHEAKEKIAQSKTVFKDLCKKSSAFAKEIQDMTYEYYFRYDYGKGAIDLAHEKNSQFTWISTSSESR